MKTRILCRMAMLALAAALGSGCTVTLQHGRFTGAPAAPNCKGPMGVSARANNLPGRIGWGTFTVFAIPVAPVTISGQGDRDMMTQVKAAAEHCGYEVKLVENPAEAAGMPVLSCKVEEIAFKNYTYFFPIVFNWGGMTVDFALTSAEGKTIWFKSYNGHGNGAYDFNSTVNKALTGLLNDVIGDLMAIDLNSTNRQV